MRKKYTIKTLLLLGIFSVAISPHAWAQDANTFLDVKPVVIDEKAKARDIIPGGISVTNRANYKMNIYAFVNNVNPEEGEEKFLDPSKADHSSSLANWIEFPRGVIELLPGETKKIDFEIRVNLNAKPGIYHATIAFASGPTRDAAELKMISAPSVMVNVEVKEDIKEVLQLSKFKTNKRLFMSGPIDLSYELKNEGNREVNATGEIRIYDKSGKEITSLDFDKDATVDVGTANVLSSTWDQIKGFGQYKAVLDLRYGEGGKSSVQDTITFWYLPWQLLVSAVALVLFSTVLIPLFAYRRRLDKGHEAVSGDSSERGVKSVANGPVGGGLSHRVIDLRKYHENRTHQ